MKRKLIHNGLSLLIATAALLGVVGSVAAADKKPNIVMLMQDDTGWADFGCYLGGSALGHPTPNLDRMAKEGAMFTDWYGQQSCTAGRSCFITGQSGYRTGLLKVGLPRWLPQMIGADLSVGPRFCAATFNQTFQNPG